MSLTRPQSWVRYRAKGLVALCLVLWGCAPTPEATPVMGAAYVGSIRLKVYAELEPQAAVTGELPFGQRVDLLRRRRNFYLVRNADGVEGWAHRTGLFNERQVIEVNALARLATESPAQGEATVYSPLNAHNHPNRLAPSIFQIQEGDRVTVIAHERHPRAPFDAGPLLEADSGRTGASRPTTESDPDEEMLPPTPPPPPEPPPAWMRLSGLSPERIRQLEADGVVDEHRSVNPRASGDLWTLVRNADGLAGWALHARLSPAIPDRVLQYAEGARVTSYFSLGPANTAGTANHWLWTTLSSNDVAFHFDSFRVFTWNNRAGRYETAFIQRGVEGYLPVEVSTREDGAVRFQIAVRERQGVLHRKTYELQGVRVRLVQSVPWPNFDPLKQPPIMQRLPEPAFDGRTAPIPQLSVWDRILESPGTLWRRLGGG